MDADTYKRLDVSGLNSFTNSDFKKAQSYLAEHAIHATVKVSRKKHFSHKYYVSYNGANLNRDTHSWLDKELAYKERREAEMELVKIAMLLYKNECMEVENISKDSA